MYPAEINQHSGEIDSHAKHHQPETGENQAGNNQEEGADNDLFPHEGQEPFHEWEIEGLPEVLGKRSAQNQGRKDTGYRRRYDEVAKHHDEKHERAYAAVIMTPRRGHGRDH